MEAFGCAELMASRFLGAPSDLGIQFLLPPVDPSDQWITGFPWSGNGITGVFRTILTSIFVAHFPCDNHTGTSPGNGSRGCGVPGGGAMLDQANSIQS